MGLFSSKKAYVSSVVYNMAGDINDRPNYLKSLITGHVIGNSRYSISENLQSGYLKGPGLRLRTFHRWAQTNYDLIGVPTGSKLGRANINHSVLAGEIPVAPDQGVMIQDVRIEIADYTSWAEQWILVNRPDDFDTAWIVDADTSTGVITITFADATTQTLTPSNYVEGAAYLYVVYAPLDGPSESVNTLHDEVAVPDPESFPDMTGWTLFSSSSSPIDYPGLETETIVTVTYSDGSPGTGPDTTYSYRDETHDLIQNVYERTTYTGGVFDPVTGKESTTSFYERQYQWNYVQKVTLNHVEIGTVPMGGGVTKTTTTETNTETIIPNCSYRILDRLVTHESINKARIWIYRLGSGNDAIDDMILNSSSTGEYIPYIPIRLDNEFLSPTFHSDEYDLAKQAYKKAMAGANYDELIESIAENENIDDIDYAYVFHGVSLNTKENAAKKYLYMYFKKLADTQNGNALDYALYKAEQLSYENDLDAWALWIQGQYDQFNPYYGTTNPGRPTQPIAKITSVAIRSSGELPTNLDMEIRWYSIEETTGTGLKKTGAKPDDIWFDIRVPDLLDRKIIRTVAQTVDIARKEVSIVDLNWQVTTNSWKTLRIIGMVHENRIYKKKSVEITAKEALDDPEESGFLVPLHYETMREMSLVDSTQMCTACAYMVFNCYKIVKRGFFSSGFFKIILVVAVIVISIVAPPFGGAAGGGLLGSGAAVGAALGFTGLAAIIVGATVNALAAMIVMRTISEASTMVFGEKLGAIIGAVASFVAMSVGTEMLNGGNLTSAFSHMGSAMNLMALTNAIGSGVAGYIQASTMGVFDKMEDMMADYKEQSKEISDIFAENIGYGMGDIDPLSLTDSTFGNFMEAPETFLNRTLLTSADIVDLSFDFVSKFTQMTTSTSLPLTAGD